MVLAAANTNTNAEREATGAIDRWLVEIDLVSIVVYYLLFKRSYLHCLFLPNSLTLILVRRFR